MSLNLETIIVLLVVGIALFWAVRALVRTVRRTGACSSCSTAGDCPVAKDPELISDLLEARSRPPRSETAS